MKFRTDVVAIPTMGGLITDLPLSAESERRFPAAVCLKVSTKVVTDYEFVVVDLLGDGVGVALHPSEAKALGLEEAPNWLPDLTGVPSVPRPGEIAQHLE
jgi:hypothetical protein